MHLPVLTKEVIQHLNLRKGDIFVDATLGCAGHAIEIIKKILPDGILIGIDQDEKALKEANKKLSIFKESSYRIIKDNFKNIDIILNRLNIKKIDGILFDLGISTLQLEDASRGFSMIKDGALDMRMDASQRLNAYDVINRYPLDRLEKIIREYGEERYSKRIARAISESRRKSNITTTIQLSELIKRTIGYKYRHLKIHPATRTFQGIRIEVNQELEALRQALGKLQYILNKNARVAVISFHSLEDRIAKQYFRNYSRENKFVLINKKPIRPTLSEIRSNPKARSAKLRIAQFKDG